MGILSRLFGGGKVQTTADRPFIIERPTLGFLNLKGAEGAKLADEDRRALSPLFAEVVASEHSSPRCQVLLIYCDFHPDGTVAGNSASVRELVKAAGAYVAIVASENAGGSCVKAMGKPDDTWSANIALVIGRKSDKFATFFRRLFEAMFAGESMLKAWVALAPQAPGREDPDAPEVFMTAQAGHVTFGR